MYRSVQFVATGLLGNDLQAFLPGGHPVGCGALRDSVITDREDVRQIKQAGFTQSSCIARTADFRASFLYTALSRMLNANVRPKFLIAFRLIPPLHFFD